MVCRFGLWSSGSIMCVSIHLLQINSLKELPTQITSIPHKQEEFRTTTFRIKPMKDINVIIQYTNALYTTDEIFSTSTTYSLIFFKCLAPLNPTPPPPFQFNGKV